MGCVSCEGQESPHTRPLVWVLTLEGNNILHRKLHGGSKDAKGDRGLDGWVLGRGKRQWEKERADNLITHIRPQCSLPNQIWLSSPSSSGGDSLSMGLFRLSKSGTISDWYEPLCIGIKIHHDNAEDTNKYFLFARSCSFCWE